MIYVKDLKKIGEGGYKAVYLSPFDENKVIKVVRNERVTPDGCFKKHGPLKRHSMQGMYRQFRREILQYLQLCKNSFSEKRYIFPIETPYGFVQTDKGLGLVVEKISAPSGQGETLDSLYKNNRLEKKHINALKIFFDECCDLHIVFGEVNTEGLMYTEARNNRPEFVLVDGIGEKLLIPVRSIFKKNNTRYIRKKEKEILNALKIKY